LDEYLGPKGEEHPTPGPASLTLYCQLVVSSTATLDVVERKHKEVAKESATSELFFWRPAGPGILWFS
jgi:hypothetical protein